MYCHTSTTLPWLGTKGVYDYRRVNIIYVTDSHSDNHQMSSFVWYCIGTTQHTRVNSTDYSSEYTFRYTSLSDCLDNQQTTVAYSIVHIVAM